MKIFSIALLLALVGCSQVTFGVQVVGSDLHDQSLTTVRLNIGNGICSGTVVGPSIILTAEHCFREKTPESIDGQGPPKPVKHADPTSMLINGRETRIIAIMSDDNDHVLVEVGFRFTHMALIASPPKVGTHVHLWGNPAGQIMVYREGYVSSYIHDMLMLNFNGFFGDSGAGIFDDAGHVVGVINIINASPRFGLVFSLMGSAPLEFTDQQYEMMGIAH